VRFARNALRHEILPRAETLVAPGTRAALVRLARLARLDEEAWQSLLPDLIESVSDGGTAERLVLRRPAFLEHHPGVRARILREAVRRLGVRLGEAGTRAALEFTSSGASGGRYSLPEGLVLARDFDHLVLFRPLERGPSGSVEIAGPGEGEALFVLGGRCFRATWSRLRKEKGPWSQAFSTGDLDFPLELRSWAPGDRIRLPGGSKKLRRLFAEARIPAGERSLRPVLVDAAGRVLWVPGLGRSEEAPEPDPDSALTIALGD
jgi:tRNA(Ile)-lysidine synthase